MVSPSAGLKDEASTVFFLIEKNRKAMEKKQDKQTQMPSITVHGKATINNYDIHDNEIHIGTLHMSELKDKLLVDQEEAVGTEEACALPAGTEAACALPAELATEEAMRLWGRLQEAQLVDAHYQPTGSRTEMAVIVFYFCKAMGWATRWSIFEKFWHKSSLNKDYDLAMGQTKSMKFIDKVKSVLAD